MSEKPEYVKVAECLYRNLQSGTYYALVKRSGKQIRRSLKTKDRKLAERKLSDFRKQVDRMYGQQGDKCVTFMELSKTWLRVSEHGHKPRTDARRQNSVKQLMPYFGIMRMRDITIRDCEAWQMKRGPMIAASTFNKERDALVGVIDMAVRDGLMLENPARQLDRRKIVKTQIVIPTREQFRLLLQTMREGDPKAAKGADLVECLACSGMRVGEAAAMRWLDIDFNKKLFTVTGGATGTKNNEARTVPLFPAFRDLLLRVREAVTEAVAPTDLILGIESAKTAIQTACRRAKLPHFTHHSMRHYFVSNAIEQNIDFKTIAAWAGHKDGGLLVAKTYGHLRDSHSAQMAERMNF